MWTIRRSAGHHRVEEDRLAVALGTLGGTQRDVPQQPGPPVAVALGVQDDPDAPLGPPAGDQADQELERRQASRRAGRSGCRRTRRGCSARRSAGPPRPRRRRSRRRSRDPCGRGALRGRRRRPRRSGGPRPRSRRRIARSRDCRGGRDPGRAAATGASSSLSSSSSSESSSSPSSPRRLVLVFEVFVVLLVLVVELDAFEGRHADAGRADPGGRPSTSIVTSSRSSPSSSRAFSIASSAVRPVASTLSTTLPFLLAAPARRAARRRIDGLVGLLAVARHGWPLLGDVSTLGRPREPGRRRSWP